MKGCGISTASMFPGSHRCFQLHFRHHVIICVQHFISGSVAIPYIVSVSWSPCFVSSRDVWALFPMKRLDCVLYEFLSAVWNVGEIFSMFAKTSSQFKRLKTFSGTICRFAWFLFVEEGSLSECITCSKQLFWPRQSWIMQPKSFKLIFLH